MPVPGLDVVVVVSVSGEIDPQSHLALQREHRLAHKSLLRCIIRGHLIQDHQCGERLNGFLKSYFVAMAAAYWLPYC